MIAATTTPAPELRLRSKHRWLVLNADAIGIRAAVYTLRRSNYWNGEQIAFACCLNLTECRLARDGAADQYTTLWVDMASFRVSDSEADEIAAALVPLGLRDQRAESQEVKP